MVGETPPPAVASGIKYQRRVSLHLRPERVCLIRTHANVSAPHRSKRGFLQNRVPALSAVLVRVQTVPCSLTSVDSRALCVPWVHRPPEVRTTLFKFRLVPPLSFACSVPLVSGLSVPFRQSTASTTGFWFPPSPPRIVGLFSFS